MPLLEARHLVDAKVVAGVTVLRDPQTGREYSVERVWSGRELVTPAIGLLRGSQMERCALYGGRRAERKETT